MITQFGHHGIREQVVKPPTVVVGIAARDLNSFKYPREV
jgi:hypothetical protein